MKKQILCYIILSGLLLSCQQDDPPPSVTPNNVSSTVSSGTWRITYYYDSDHEDTSSFKGYNLTFNSSGSVVAVKNTSEVSGTWATGTDDSQVKLIFAFPAGTEFTELSDDWHVLERSDTRIGLRDISGGNGGTDYLTLEKN